MVSLQDVTPAAGRGVSRQAVQQIAAAHGFTLEELEANRAGRIHARQVEAGARRGRVDVRFGWIMLVLALALLIAGAALAFFPRALKDLDFTFALPDKRGTVVATTLMGLTLAMLPFAFGVLALRHGRKVVAAYAAGRAERIEGPLQKGIVRGRRLPARPFYSIGQTSLWPMNNRGFEMLAVGAVHRAYYINVARRNELLSIEPL